MAYNTKLYRSTGSAWEEVRVGSEWGMIANKPTNFPPTSHTHPEYVKTSGNQTITGIKQIDNSDLRMNGGSVSYLRPATTGGWARGFWWQKNATDDVPYQRIGGIGVLGNNLSVSKFYIGYGESPWSNSILEAFPDYVNINGTLRTIATTDSDPDNTVATKGYVDSKTSDAMIDGLLDANNKIKASLLPSFVFGSMRFVSTWDGSAKCSVCNGTGLTYTGSRTCPTCNGAGEVGGLACGRCSGSGTENILGDCETCGGDGVIESDNNKLSTAKAIIESYVARNGGSLRGCYFIASQAITLAVSSPYVLHKEEQDRDSTTIEPGDWLICMSDDGHTWGVINNTYQNATTTSKGIVKLATEQDGINGTSTTLAMTPKATAAAINEITGVTNYLNINGETVGFYSATSQTTKAVYAATSQLSTSTAKRYLIGTQATTSLSVQNCNANVYMQSGKIYSAPTSDSDSGNTVATKGYVDSKTSVAMIDGLLDEDNKIKASLLPSFVFGGMRFVTTWEDTENNSLEHLHTNVIDPYITSNGGSSRGCYVIVTRKMEVSIPDGYSLYREEIGTEYTPLPMTSGQLTIERGDWLICISDDGKTWAVINNSYRDATIVDKGIVRLATEQEGATGTSTKLAMTPKATAAAINAAINETLGDIDTALSNILGA